jgi:hypothetical protein
MVRQRHLDTRRRLTSAAFDGTRERALVPGPRSCGANRLPRLSKAVELKRPEPWGVFELLLNFTPRPCCASCGNPEAMVAAFGAFDEAEALCLYCWNFFAPVFLAARARERVA